MAYTLGKYTVTDKAKLTASAYSFTVSCPDVALLANAGQFVHIKIDGFTLRRPISICQIDKANGTIRLVFEVRGEGTNKLAALEKGDKIDILGPLGKGFALLDKAKKAVVVGGGIGVPPLLQTAEFYGGNATAIIGFRNKDAVILNDDFTKNGCNVVLCTDDGSAGEKGFVTTALARLLREQKVDIIYSCGPMAMLKAVAAEAEKAGVRCQVSLEERMGCGVGACLVCACKVKVNGSEHYGHVCKDGPVFEAEEVCFDE